MCYFSNTDRLQFPPFDAPNSEDGNMPVEVFEKIAEDLFPRARRQARTRPPRLRIIFTWMRSNRGELARLPEFAADHGARELDVRFVSPTPGVDVTPELLGGEDPRTLNAELAAAARDAVRRGL